MAAGRVKREMRGDPSARSGGAAGGAPGRRVRVTGAVLAAATALLATAAGWPAGHATSGQGVRAAGHPHVLRPLAEMFVPVPGVPPAPHIAPLRHLRQADLVVVSAGRLPHRTVAAIRALPGVRAAEQVDAARIQVNGKFVAVLGVDPSRFRAFAGKRTAADTALWRGVASGEMAVSYTMGKLGRLPVGSIVNVVGRHHQTMVVGGIGTVGIAGVDAVISGSAARSLGFPSHNALVISVTPARISAVTARIKARVARTATVEQLVSPGARSAAEAGAAATAAAARQAPGALLTPAQVMTFLRAALSRVGMPYVWGAAGPRAFDCSGLVQWSLAQAGVIMPRVAADQARTGPAVPVSRLQPGDLLFYHTDPTAPGYISHVAIYLGKGWMIQAPQPGMTVEVVPVDLGSDFAGAIAVSPRIAAAVAASPVG